MRSIVCPRCDGKGKSVVIRGKDHLSATWYIWQECSACRGSGYKASVFSSNLLHPEFLSMTSCLPLTKSVKKESSRVPVLAGFKL